MSNWCCVDCRGRHITENHSRSKLPYRSQMFSRKTYQGRTADVESDSSSWSGLLFYSQTVNCPHQLFKASLAPLQSFSELRYISHLLQWGVLQALESRGVMWAGREFVGHDLHGANHSSFFGLAYILSLPGAKIFIAACPSASTRIYDSSWKTSPQNPPQT